MRSYAFSETEILLLFFTRYDKIQTDHFYNQILFLKINKTNKFSVTFTSGYPSIA